MRTWCRSACRATGTADRACSRDRRSTSAFCRSTRSRCTFRKRWAERRAVRSSGRGPPRHRSKPRRSKPRRLHPDRKLSRRRRMGCRSLIPTFPPTHAVAGPMQSPICEGCCSGLEHATETSRPRRAKSRRRAADLHTPSMQDVRRPGYRGTGLRWTRVGRKNSPSDLVRRVPMVAAARFAAAGCAQGRSPGSEFARFTGTSGTWSRAPLRRRTSTRATGCTPTHLHRSPRESPG